MLEVIIHFHNMSMINSNIIIQDTFDRYRITINNICIYNASSGRAHKKKYFDGKLKFLLNNFKKSTYYEKHL